MRNQKVIAAAIIAISGILITSLAIVFVLWNQLPVVGARKAIILCSANDFYGSEDDDDFNDGNDSNLNRPGPGEFGNWTFILNDMATDAYHSDTVGHPSSPAGSLMLDVSAAGPSLMNSSFSLDWDANYEFVEYAYYNLSAWVLLEDQNATTGGARIGLQWLNSTGHIVREDWSNFTSQCEPGVWKSLNITGVCNNETNNEITKLNLVLSCTGTFPDAHSVYFDEIKVERWIQINLTDPTDPPPPPPQGKINSDGFPAQALQVYWILRNHGYTDDNIFLMLYYAGDNNGIDINRFDAISNDLIGADIDVANASVNATRFKQELNVSFPGSFASEINPEDQLIIYMADHGSNKVSPDGNATFHFEADGSFIKETEFYDLVKEINCKRMMINVDCCFSGNFLNEDNNIGQSWYDLPNCLFVSAAANVLSWYWIDNTNPDGWAGSWFFHKFWDELDQGQTILNAYINAIGFIPAVNQGAPLFQVQNPLMQDNLGIANTWGFSGTPIL